ncbi:MAG TPA: LCP family protein, partial [Streptomyces sp.]|nr:LCP family protein [Streptomyces sp.]
YQTEQFAFIEEQTDDSEDVIDWLKFSESRTERREEAKRRGRNRWVALVVVLVLVAVGGVGYLWFAGKLPGLGDEKGGTATAAGQQRDVIVVHLRSLDGGGSSTALLVDNADAKRGNTVLLPNSLAVSGENGTTTTLAKSVEDEGAAPTRESLGTLLGADIKGSWRLDTPYLENLVELVGGIKLNANATVPGEKKGDEPLVKRGRAQTLNGQAAVAYATYRGRGEQQTRQLERFGAVMQQTLRKLSSDSKTATRTVETLGQIPDPSLPEPELGASLAKLAGQAKSGSYETQLLPVQPNGTLSARASDGLVKQVLGGTVKNTDPDAAPRVKVVNASGDRGNSGSASAALVNSGYTVVDGAAGRAQARSAVTYSDVKQKGRAEEIVKTLGLPNGAARKGKEAANADVTVVLGKDYKG